MHAAVGIDGQKSRAIKLVCRVMQVCVHSHKCWFVLLQVDSEPQGVPRVASAQSTGSGDAADGSAAGSAAADARVRIVYGLETVNFKLPCNFCKLW